MDKKCFISAVIMFLASFFSFSARLVLLLQGHGNLLANICWLALGVVLSVVWGISVGLQIKDISSPEGTVSPKRYLAAVRYIDPTAGDSLTNIMVMASGTDKALEMICEEYRGRGIDKFAVLSLTCLEAE